MRRLIVCAVLLGAADAHYMRRGRDRPLAADEDGMDRTDSAGHEVAGRTGAASTTST